MSTKKITFHLGPRNCGKSEFVERELKDFENKVYIGTLPKISKYSKTITKHRCRRGKDWETIELSFNFEKDISKINNVIKKKQRVSSCMLDGIWTWYYFTNQKLNNNFCPIYFADKLSEIIKDNNIVWKLVDVFYNNSEIGLNRTLLLIQNRIIENLEITNIINWSNE